MRRLSRRSFLWGAAAATAGVGGWRWLTTRREDDGIPWPLRRAHEINEQLARDYFRGTRLSPSFPRELAREPRPNGSRGLEDDLDAANWRLNVSGLADKQDTELQLTLDQIKALPRVEMVTELKCIEGWSAVVQWAGARFADFINVYRPETRSGDPPDPQRAPEDLVGYVSIETEDGSYYVGLDMESALHPQTLLCYEMNGKPLTEPHGAPLRLAIPVKYGIKNIKRIGTIRFTDRRPADYWAERGYDWYAGH
jgi:DMSO/TMAO reductase YedYZ molybdopterin-dependent catalytic subunit